MLITKLYMERRAVAMFEAQWPDPTTKFFVLANNYELDEYCAPDYTLSEAVKIMLKDFINMYKYAEFGWQSKVTTPTEVEKAVQIATEWVQNKEKDVF